MTHEPSTGSGAGSDTGVLATISRVRIVPVLTVRDPDEAVQLVQALVDGGLTAVEITLRTPTGLEAIRRAAVEVPAAVVGAGSVTSAGLAAAAVDAGARFLIAPGIDNDTIEFAQREAVPFLPGVATATELLRAVNAGIDIVKLFPAELIGGPALIQAFAAVWPDVRFMPTGGISASTAPSYLALPQVLAVGGSWMVRSTALTEHDWPSVTRDAATAAEFGGQPT